MKKKKKTQGNRSVFYNIFLAKEDIKIVINYVYRHKTSQEILMRILCMKHQDCGLECDGI